MDLEHNVFQEWTLIASVPISKEKKCFSSIIKEGKNNGKMFGCVVE